MSLPLVTTRMKQSHYFSRGRVDTCYVGTFAKITAVACKCKIVDFVGAAVLFGDNVLNVMRQFAVLLRQAAISQRFSARWRTRWCVAASTGLAAV